MTPFFCCRFPNGNFDLLRIFVHVDSFWESEYHFDMHVTSSVGWRIREWDIFEALLNSKDWSHCPGISLLALLGVLIHLKVNDSSHDKVILNLVRGQVVITGPKGTQHNLSIGLFLRKLWDIVSKDKLVSKLVASQNVCPDAKEDIFFRSDLVENFLACRVSFCWSFVLILVLFDFLLGKFCINIHEFKHFGANLIKLF